MKKKIIKFAERKMPLFSAMVSVWEHNKLKELIGSGFQKVVITHNNGLCELFSTGDEINKICRNIIWLIDHDERRLEDAYKKAREINKKADELLIEYRKKKVMINAKSFDKAFGVFAENLGVCTILPFWVLYAINMRLEKGEKQNKFKKVLSWYEELKGQTRYPQITKEVIRTFLDKVADKFLIPSSLESCLHPDELRRAFSGEKSINLSTLKKRMKWCAVMRDREIGEVKYFFDSLKLPFKLPTVLKTNTQLLKGTIAFNGKIIGRAKILNDIDDMKKFKSNDVLVSIQSSPALMPAITKCAAIVTDEGGIMCHAAIISRELKIPCIIGTKIATKIFKDGDLVEVDANKGIVRVLKGISEFRNSK